MASGQHGGQGREGISPADSIWHALFTPAPFSCKSQTHHPWCQPLKPPTGVWMSGVSWEKPRYTQHFLKSQELPEHV